MFQKITLSSGLRIIAVPDANAQTAAVLVLVGTGSKYETKNENGLSHFLEHMLFKGTKKRPTALKIAETLDKIGGAYNAFTSKEFTGFWAKVDSKNLDLAIDWVSDIFLNSKIKPEEIEKEKGVIIEEFNMYLDMPMRHIGDLWEELLYGDQPAGWKTIGTKENVKKFQRKDFLDYLEKHYSAINTIVCVAGNFKEGDIVEKIKKFFADVKNGPVREKTKVIESQKKPQSLFHFKKTDQTHLCLGVRGFNLFESEKYSQQILAIILGGNMSSRLFISIREKKGLAYYVHTVSENYADSGYLMTQAGIPHKNLEEVAKLILKEYKDIKENGVSEEELQKAKDYLKGSSVLELESSDAKASFFGMQELFFGKILTIEEKFKMIDGVSLEDIKKTAEAIFTNENLNLTAIGPHRHEIKLKKELRI